MPTLIASGVPCARTVEVIQPKPLTYLCGARLCRNRPVPCRVRPLALAVRHVPRVTSECAARHPPHRRRAFCMDRGASRRHARSGDVGSQRDRPWGRAVPRDRDRPRGRQANRMARASAPALRDRARDDHGRPDPQTAREPAAALRATAGNGSDRREAARLIVPFGSRLQRFRRRFDAVASAARGELVMVVSGGCRRVLQGLSRRSLSD